MMTSGYFCTPTPIAGATVESEEYFRQNQVSALLNSWRNFAAKQHYHRTTHMFHRSARSHLISRSTGTKPAGQPCYPDLQLLRGRSILQFSRWLGLQPHLFVEIKYGKADFSKRVAGVRAKPFVCFRFRMLARRLSRLWACT
jgi:hypothetical protein